MKIGDLEKYLADHVSSTSDEHKLLTLLLSRSDVKFLLELIKEFKLAREMEFRR